MVRANLLAGAADVAPGLVANVAGGGECSMIELIDTVEQIVGRPIQLDRRPSELGDVGRTDGSTELARVQLGWQPQVTLREGLERQHEWHLSRR